METNLKVHYTTPYFANPSHPISVVVVGCGGTGSLVLPRLARLDQALEQLGHPGLIVKAYDNDIVEAHNVGRQNFTKYDVGQNKANCVIQKINLAFGLQWQADPSLCEEPPKANIVITCVDKVNFRKKMNTYVKNYDTNPTKLDYTTPYYWLDCGNGKNFGQVVLASIGAIEQPKSKYVTLERLKTVYDIFGDLQSFDTKETQGIESCSFADSLLEQDLFINDAIAFNAVELLWRLLLKLHLSQQGVVINLEEFKTKGIPL